MNWLFLIQTDTGFQPFAALYTAEACAVLSNIIREASGMIGACIYVMPWVAS